jgi:hypothetical protein
MQAIKQWIKKYFGQQIYRSQLSPARKNEMEQWTAQWKDKPATKLSDTSFDIFTYHGEDGIIQYLLNKLKSVPASFVDIGAGDCIKSNCATLAVHNNWEGVFIDKDEKQLSVGNYFYRQRIAKGAKIRFIAAEVKAENISTQLQKEGLSGPVGLLSVDIDGNDFWIWKAIEDLQPAIVVIEAKVEFGLRSIAVPCGPANHYSIDAMYNGASVEAFRKLGLLKGYKLAGANKQGYNLFFVKQDAAIPEAATAEILNDPDTKKSFYPEQFFNTHRFELI